MNYYVQHLHIFISNMIQSTECFKESNFHLICCVNVNLGPEESVPWDIKGIHVLNETFEVKVKGQTFRN